ncbi:MAG: alpha/beta fold hydrolase [Anaerolineae bacterium]|nr:alpha/beta fold hydrolase [Anaerolineae bacterium]
MKRVLLMATAGLVLVMLVSANMVNLTMAQATETPPPMTTGLGTPPPAKTVVITLSDGTEIKGNFYPSFFSGRQAPAALLLHQNGGRREEWVKFIPSLQAAGYAVLAVDQRGFGKTGGRTDYKKMPDDAVEMVNWLAQQPSIQKDEIALIGASVGSNAAIIACGKIEACKVAVALSPSVNYFNLKPADAMKEMKGKALFLVAAQQDRESSTSLHTLALAASPENNVSMRLYASSVAHGVVLFQYEDLAPAIIAWLNMYNHAVN